jgi:hypothetical protein
MLFNSWGWDYDEPATYIHEVIAERSDSNMSSTTFPWIFEQWHGAEYDHAGMAQVLADHLSGVMGWSPGPSDVMSGLGVNGNVANGGFEGVAPFGGYGWRYYTDPGVSRENDPIGAWDGEYYLRLADGAASHQPYPAYPGDTAAVTVWMRGAVGGDQVEISLDWRDEEMWTIPLKTDAEVKTLTTAWKEYSMAATAPTGTANPVFHGRITFTAAAGATVDIDDVVLNVSAGGNNNVAPSISMTSPSGGKVSGTVTIAGSVSDADGSVSSVVILDTFEGSEQVLVTINSPEPSWIYNWDTSSEADGNHTIRAEATDNDGAKASDSVTVKIGGGGGKCPPKKPGCQ